MGQKVNPTGFRLPVNRAWRSRWFAPKKNFAAFLVEDQKIREASATPTACACRCSAPARA